MNAKQLLVFDSAKVEVYIHNEEPFKRITKIFSL